MADVVVRRVGMLIQELARHQHESRRAETALERRALDECFLHGVELRACLHRLHLRSLGQGGEVEATGHGGAVDQYRAAAAQPLAAAFARAEEPELLAQHLDQRLVRRHLRLDAFTVKPELDRAPHLFSAWNTASGFIGSSVRRTPIASWIALATAGETPKVAVSPTPLAPKGPVRCSATTASLTISPGRSSRPGILYSASEALRSWPCSS